MLIAASIVDGRNRRCASSQYADKPAPGPPRPLHFSLDRQMSATSGRVRSGSFGMGDCKCREGRGWSDPAPSLSCYRENSPCECELSHILAAAKGLTLLTH